LRYFQEFVIIHIFKVNAGLTQRGTIIVLTVIIVFGNWVSKVIGD